MKSKRIQWLDFAKGLIMLMVVICHSSLSSGSHSYWMKLISYILLILAMPMFFAISGYLYKPTHTIKSFFLMLYKKVISLIIPYIIFTFIVVIIHMTPNHNILDSWDKLYMDPVGYLWFLYSLFFIFVIFSIMNLFKIKLWIQVIISILCMFAQMYLPHQYDKSGNTNPLSGIMGFMICFVLGFVIHEYQNKFKKYITKYMILIFGVIWILLDVIQLYITGINYVTNVFNYADVITKLLSIFLVFAIFIIFPHNIIFKYFDKYGKYTLIIYLVHLPIIFIVTKVLSKLSFDSHISIFLISIIVAWYISVLVYYLTTKSRIVDFVFYPRGYINRIFLRTKIGKWMVSK